MMKWHSEWFGTLLIPDTEEELRMLESLSKKPESTYEWGESEWIDEAYIKHPRNTYFTSAVLPLGKGLVLNR
jgi:hypothetical protein